MQYLVKEKGFIQSEDKEVKSPCCFSFEGVRGGISPLNQWTISRNSASWKYWISVPSSGPRLGFVVEGSETGQVNKKIHGEYHVMAELTFHDYLYVLKLVEATW